MSNFFCTAYYMYIIHTCVCAPARARVRVCDVLVVKIVNNNNNNNKATDLLQHIHVNVY